MRLYFPVALKTDAVTSRPGPTIGVGSPYARKAVAVALSQLGIYGGDAQVFEYTGGLDTNWCKAFALWVYQQTGESTFQSPREAAKSGGTDQTVFQALAKQHKGFYVWGNAGTPQSEGSGKHKTYKFKDLGGPSYLANHPLQRQPQVGDVVDIVTSGGTGHSVLVVNTENWPKVTVVSGNTRDRARAAADGRLGVFEKRGSYGNMVGVADIDFSQTPVVCIWDMSKTQKSAEAPPLAASKRQRPELLASPPPAQALPAKPKHRFHFSDSN